MAVRFADILEGARARKPVEFPKMLSGLAPEQPIIVDLVPLLLDEDAQVLEAARAFAVSKGVTNPERGEPLYDLELMVQTLLKSVLVHDSGSSSHLEYFFGTEVEKCDVCTEVRGKEVRHTPAERVRMHLDRERIAYLSQLQQTWQDEISPHGGNKSEDEILALVLQLSESESPLVPFERFRPASLGRLVLSMAKLLAAAHLSKSLPGSSSTTGTASSTASRAGSSVEP